MNEPKETISIINLETGEEDYGYDYKYACEVSTEANAESGSLSIPCEVPVK